ncbi:MAG TPA: cohesin domain-containing protein [Candidatus Krumholzibacteria bacterium]|nr:cohesin domain-containing protein [Candidatus Krumholzibacteria bacterium]
MMRSTAGALLLVLLSVLPASAQFQPEPGDITLSPDPRGRAAAMNVTSFVPFEVYVVVTDPPGGIAEYEVGIAGLQSLGLFVLGTELLAAGTDAAPFSDLDYIVSLSECTAGSFVRLVRLRLFPLAPIPFDTVLCLRAPEPSSFGDVPGYVDCAGESRSFGVPRGPTNYPDGCLILNPSGGCFEQHYYSMPERLAQVGRTVRLPFTSDYVEQANGFHCWPRVVFGVEGVLRFDPSILSFEGVTTGGAAPDWSVSFTERAPGEIEIVAGATETSELLGASSLPDLGGDALLQLAFEVLAPGTADVVLEMRECWVQAGNLGPCNPSATRTVRGAITQDPVRSEQSSFGSLKARFGQ